MLIQDIQELIDIYKRISPHATDELGGVSGLREFILRVVEGGYRGVPYSEKVKARLRKVMEE